MKHPSITLGLCTIIIATAITGCVGLQIGGGNKQPVTNATIGQQLIDLKMARDTGAINETEYQNQKARLLGHK